MKNIDWFKQLQTWTFISAIGGLTVYLSQFNPDVAIGFGLGIVFALMGLGIWVPDTHAEIVTNRKNSLTAVLRSSFAVAILMIALGLFPIGEGFVRSFWSAMQDLSLKSWVLPTLAGGVLFLIVSIAGLKMISKEPKIIIIPPAPKTMDEE